MIETKPELATATDTVTRRLEHYAKRGVFRGFSPVPVRGGKATFRILWHRGRTFELQLDPAKGTLKFPVVLPAIPPDSEMYTALKDFIRARTSSELPEHRRIDRARAEVRTYNRTGDVAITLTSKDGDLDYATQRIVHLVHEIYLAFLCDGRYRDYMIAHLGLDPDLD